MAVSEQFEVTEHPMHALAEAAHLHEAGLDGEPQSYGDQQDHQDVVGQIGVDG